MIVQGIEYGLRAVHSDGVVVPPISLAKSTMNTGEYVVRQVLLSERIQLVLGKSQWVKVKVDQSSTTENSVEEVEVIAPKESILASQSCGGNNYKM